MRLFSAFYVLLILAAASTGLGSEKRSDARENINRTLLNIGNISMWVWADGKLANAPDGSAGAFFPRGTAPVILQDGLVWGGQVYDSEQPLVRVGGQLYSVGHRAGRILAPGLAEDRDDPEVNRVWRIRRDYFTADLRQDAAELLQKNLEEVNEAEIAAVRSRYEDDWRNWPAEKGAPFYDAENDGRYSPQFAADGAPLLFPDADEPGLHQADQVVWLVVNDLDAIAVSNFSGSPPIGVEMQVSLCGYADAGARGSSIFRRHRLIYKGVENVPDSAHLDSMYLGLWSDPDLGSAGDDLAGCDTLLHLGYVYNSRNQDPGFQSYNLSPPAVGYDLIQGPIAPYPFPGAASGSPLPAGFQRLGMTMFVSFAPGSQTVDPFWSTPPTYETTLQIHNILRGFLPRPVSPASPFIDPVTGRPTKFTLYGDPVTGAGWVDQGTGNRRFIFGSGPFSLALGDTQDVIIALIGGHASDRLHSVRLLKHYSRTVQQIADNQFVFPRPPPRPHLSATELDGQILLKWGEDLESVAQVESTRVAEFKFEGYNVYQLPDAQASLAQAKKLATFDLKNDFTTILQEVFDPASYSLVRQAVQTGTNTGLARHFLVAGDSLNQQPLHNGQTYHFAVTTYTVNPDPQAAIRALESAPAVISVTPQTLRPGLRWQSAPNDTIPAAHTRGIGTGRVLPIIVDPAELTGDSYQVAFTEHEEVSDRGRIQKYVLWRLTNLTTGDTLLSNQSNQTGDEFYQYTDGFILKVIAPREDFQPGDGSGGGIIEVSYGGQDPCAGQAISRDGCESFGGNTVWHSLNSTGHYYVSAGGGLGELTRIARYIEYAIPSDYEMRFTESGGWGVFAFDDNKIARLPFELWNTGTGTPDDPSDDVRMIPFLLPNVATSAGWSWATGMDAALGSPTSGWVYFMEPEDRTPGTTSYDRFAAICETAGAGATYPFAEDGSRDGYFADFQGGFVYPIGRFALCDSARLGTPPPAGTTIRILTTKPHTQEDVFQFSTSGFEPTYSDFRARDDVQQINVFPNPYYGIFRFESRFGGEFVTFSHLPERATVRIFTLAGVLARTLEKKDASQFMLWDLKNESGRFVGSGIYLVHVDLPDLGTSKILKLAVVQ